MSNWLAEDLLDGQEEAGADAKSGVPVERKLGESVLVVAMNRKQWPDLEQAEEMLFSQQSSLSAVHQENRLYSTRNAVR